MAIVPVINEKRKHSLSSQIQPPDGAGFVTLGASAHVHIIDSKDKNYDKGQKKLLYRTYNLAYLHSTYIFKMVKLELYVPWNLGFGKERNHQLGHPEIAPICSSYSPRSCRHRSAH